MAKQKKYKVKDIVRLKTHLKKKYALTEAEVLEVLSEGNDNAYIVRFLESGKITGIGEDDIELKNK